MLKEEVLSFVKEVGRMPITVRLEKELVENFPVIGDLVKKGIQQGIQQGIQEGIQRGIQKGKQGDLIKILEARFGEIEDSLKERIKRIEQIEKLEELLISAIRVSNLEEFKSVIAEE
jgi:flagellar biosynthesis/type III secretory pathway protein FliH